MTAKPESILLTNSCNDCRQNCTTQRPIYQLIINITLSKDLRKDKTAGEFGRLSILQFCLKFWFSDLVVIAMVIILKFVTASFKMQFSLIG